MASARVSYQQVCLSLDPPLLRVNRITIRGSAHAPLHFWYAGRCMNRQPRLTRNKHTQDKCLLCWFPCVCSSALIQWSEEEIVQRGFKRHETNLAYRSGKTRFLSKRPVLKVSSFFSSYINMINPNRGEGTGVTAGGGRTLYLCPQKSNTVDEAVSQSWPITR